MRMLEQRQYTFLGEKVLNLILSCSVEFQTDANSLCPAQEETIAREENMLELRDKYFSTQMRAGSDCYEPV